MNGTGAVRVVFIGATGRSGSTLISRVLGAVPGFCSVGELVHLWDHGVRRNEMCGCGVRFRECGFWTDVGERAFGGWDRLDLPRLLDLHRKIVRTRYVPLLAAPGLAPSFRRRLTPYAEVVGRVYAAIQAVSGCEVVVDSSKAPASAALARRTPGVDVRMIHLVRSSHGVCYSLTKKLPNPDYGDALMPRQPPARGALEWSGLNLTLELIARLGLPSALVRYEDFVARPRTQLDRILDFARPGAGAAPLPLRGDRSVDLPRSHAIAGNPMRARAGREPLVADEEWRTRLPRRTRWLVTAITAAGLARYGYPLR